MTIQPVAPPHLLTVAESGPRPEPGGTAHRDPVGATVPREARLRVRRAGGVLRAADVVVAIELLSPGSLRTDHVHKRGEYADAGIPHYWIVDVTEPVSLLACHLAGEFGYHDGGAVAARFSTTSPFAVTLDLNGLL